MTLEVQAARLEDLPELAEWRIRVLRDVFELPEDADLEVLREENVRYYRKHLTDGTHTACFARDTETGKTLGCGGICYYDEMPSPDNPAGSCGYLMNIYVTPEHRSAGVGREIVEYLLRDAAGRKTGKVFLETSDAGRSLYERAGFTDLAGYMKLP